MHYVSTTLGVTANCKTQSHTDNDATQSRHSNCIQQSKISNTAQKSRLTSQYQTRRSTKPQATRSLCFSNVAPGSPFPTPTTQPRQLNRLTMDPGHDVGLQMSPQRLPVLPRQSDRHSSFPQLSLGSSWRAVR